MRCNGAGNVHPNLCQGTQIARKERSSWQAVCWPGAPGSAGCRPCISLARCQEQTMARYTYDITIIGGGSGGLTAARLAQALGARVCLVDKERLGGDCLHYGCVPSKSLIHVAKVAQQARHAAAIGLAPAQLAVDMPKVTAYVQGVIERAAQAEQTYTA